MTPRLATARHPNLRWLLSSAVGVALLSGIPILLQNFSSVPYWHGGSPLALSTVATLAAGFLGCAAIAWREHRSGIRFAICFLGAAAFLALTIGEATGSFIRVGQFWDDDYRYKLPFWIGAAVGLYLARRSRNLPRPGLILLETGFALQGISNFLDMGDGDLFKLPFLSAPTLDFLTESSELVFAEVYVAALIAILFGRFGTIASRQALQGPLGTRARAVFREYRLFKNAKYPPYKIACYPGLKAIVMLGVILWSGFKIAPAAKQASGRPILAQFYDLLRLGYGHGVDPLTYYHQELYRPGGIAEAAHYLTRYETKNGLISAINHMRPQPYARSEMTDKLLFADCCARFGIPSPPILLLVENGEVTRRPEDRSALDRDLFAKPRAGKGARGTSKFRRIGPARYAAADGTELALDEVIARLKEQSLAAPMFVQPYIRNDPTLADLATDSLVVIRVITCLNERNEPEATHGLLRVLAKLEPSWPTREEFGAPIDLATGRLGLFTGDRPETCVVRYALHPVTGSPVLGRTFEGWPAVRDLAVFAHAQFRHRIVIGWDLAFSEGRPLVLEGNNVLDIAFPQRTHRSAIGRGRLGELLQLHLDELCASLEAERGGVAPSHPSLSPTSWGRG